MKANAPEKIYIVIDPVWGSMSVNYNRNDTNNIEYTRTDAFIEKACAWLENNLQGVVGGSIYIEDFKKAMKLWKE